MIMDGGQASSAARSGKVSAGHPPKTRDHRRASKPCAAGRPARLNELRLSPQLRAARLAPWLRVAGIASRLRAARLKPRLLAAGFVPQLRAVRTLLGTYPPLRPQDHSMGGQRHERTKVMQLHELPKGMHLRTNAADSHLPGASTQTHTNCTQRCVPAIMPRRAFCASR